MRRWLRHRAAEHAGAIALYGFAAAGIAALAVTLFPLADATVNDSLPYASMTSGVPLQDVPKPFRYRVVVPFLARLLPHADVHHIQLAWGLLDVVALTLAGWAVFLFLRHRGFATLPALLGGSLFYVSWVVVRYSGTVLVDAASYAALAVAAYAVVSRRTVLLLVSVTVGMAVRETTALVVVLILLIGGPRPVVVRQLAACIPGLAGYAALRLAMPTDLGYSYSLGRIVEAFGSLGTMHGLAGAVVQFMLTFGPLWVLAVIGWCAADPPLPRRTAWLVPIVLVVPYLVGSNLDRVWFLAFPVVLAFSVAGIEEIGRWSAPNDSVARTPRGPTRWSPASKDAAPLSTHRRAKGPHLRQIMGGSLRGFLRSPVSLLPGSDSERPSSWASLQYSNPRLTHYENVLLRGRRAHGDHRCASGSFTVRGQAHRPPAFEATKEATRRAQLVPRPLLRCGVPRGTALWDGHQAAPAPQAGRGPADRAAM